MRPRSSFTVPMPTSTPYSCTSRLGVRTSRAAPYAQHVAVEQQRVAMCAIASVTFFATTRSRTAAGADAIRQSSSVEIGSKTSSTAANGADAGQFAGPTAVTQGSVQTANAAATRKSAAQGAFTASVSSPEQPNRRNANRPRASSAFRRGAQTRGAAPPPAAAGTVRPDGARDANRGYAA